MSHVVRALKEYDVVTGAYVNVSGNTVRFVTNSGTYVYIDFQKSVSDILNGAPSSATIRYKTESIDVSKIQALYDRPGSPGEKAAALAALKRFGVNPKQKLGGGGIRYRMNVGHRTKKFGTVFHMNVHERDGANKIRRMARQHAANKYGGSPDDYDVHSMDRQWGEGVEDWHRRGAHKPHWEDGYYHGFSGQSPDQSRKGTFKQAYDKGYQVGSSVRDRALRSKEDDD